MLKMTHRYAKALMEFAEENGLELVYRQAIVYVTQPGKGLPPAPLGDFLSSLPEHELEGVIDRFLGIARDKMNVLETEIISAVPLKQQQLYELEVKLIHMFRKQLNITTTVDPSLIGGLRIIVGNTVIDDSIKRKLFDLKSSIYKGVYSKQ